MVPSAANLQAIRDMLERSRSDRARTGDIYVAWALLVAIALAAHAALDAAGWSAPWAVWFALMPLGVAYAGYRGRQEAGRAVTYASRVEGKVWLWAGVVVAALCIAGLGSKTLPPGAITPVVCGVVAVAMAVSGELYQSRVLAGSAALFLAVSVVGMFVPWHVQFGLMGAALLGGYVVPGITMMRAARGDG